MAAEFIAKTAVYCRERGFMKDMPALLVRAARGAGRRRCCERVFDRVIDDGKMLRNFVQIVRSGVVGPQVARLAAEAARPALVRARAPTSRSSARRSADDPSLADVIKMVHPKPATASRAALYGT